MSETQRNDPCPCGSGKKYKKCCMNARKAIFSPAARGKYVYIALAVIFILSIFLRYYGYQQPHKLTFDEGLYAELLGEQLKENPGNYSTQVAYQNITADGTWLPKYLDRPLFKHPPLYSYLIAINYKIFGSSELAAVSVSILFGSLMVLIIFLLGKQLYDERVGLLAAFFLCIDPVHWVCSERIWMETTLSFFILLAILFFAYGRKQESFLPWSGVSIGFALLTKYPGILPLFIIFSYALFVERSLLKKFGFWLLCILSLAVFTPWLIWVWNVYGNLFDAMISTHNLSSYWNRAVSNVMSHKALISVCIIVIGLCCVFWPKIKKPIIKRAGWIAPLMVVCAIISIPFFRDIILGIFIWKKEFLTSWSYPFSGSSWHFYLTRLNEFSPVYLCSLLSIFFIFGERKEDRLLLLASFWIVGVFIILRNYQSRYILPAIPFLLLLSARWQVWAYDKLSLKSEITGGTSNISAYRSMLRIAFVAMGLYFILKTLRTDLLLAIGPDFGYF